MPQIRATHKWSGTTIEGQAIKTPSGYKFQEFDVDLDDARWTIEDLTPKLPERPGAVIDIFEIDGENFYPPVRAMLCLSGVWAVTQDTGRGAHILPDIIDDFKVVLP